MAISADEWLRQLFPALAGMRYAITSPADEKYNCIAWAAGDASRWWEPDPMDNYYWPTGVSREYTIESYIAAYESVGLVISEGSGDSENAVAIFAVAGQPSHASRILPSGLWTSKLGKFVDIEHELAGLEGSEYGRVTTFMKRSQVPRTNSQPTE